MGKSTPMNKKFFFNLDIQKSGVDDQNGQFFVEGYAATSDLDRQGDIIAIEALKSAAEEMVQNGQTVFFNHNYDRCVGRLENTTVDDIGMKVKIYVSEWEEELRKKIEEKIINKFSVGGRMVSSRVISPEEASQKFPEKVQTKPTHPINLIEKMELFEVSIVGLPANAKAEFIHKSLYDALKEEVTKVEDVKTEQTIEIPTVETPKVEEIKKEEVVEAPKVEIKVEEPKVDETQAEIDVTQVKELIEGAAKAEEEAQAEEAPKEEPPKEEAPKEVPKEPKKPYYYYYGKDTKEKLDKLVGAVDGLTAKIDELIKAVSQLAQPQKSEEAAKILEIVTDLNSKVKEIPVAVQKTTPVVTSETPKEIKKEIPTPEQSFLQVLQGK